MKNLYKKIISIGAASAISLSLMMAGEPVTADTMSELESKQSELEQERQDVEAALQEYEGKADETDKYLEEYDNKMKIQEEQVENVKQQIEVIEENIAGLETEIEQKQADVDKGIEQFGQRLRVMYMSGNDSMASVLTGSTDFYDMLSRMEFVERVSKHDNDMIDSLHVEIADLESSKTELDVQLEKMETKKAEEEQYYEELRETYNNHAETKQMQQNMIEDYKNRANEIAEEQDQVEKELQAEIVRLQKEAEKKRQEEEQRRKEEEQRRREEEELREKEAEESGQQYIAEEIPEAEPIFTSYSDTGFIWPVPTVRNMTDTYGYRTIAEEGGASDFHKGIDINKPGCAGEPVVASAGGTVIQAGDKGNGYGNCVIIDHGNGISTLYAHNNSVAVSVGDNVEQGQTIAYIGCTGYAYGNHCHFEVRVNGQTTDPLNYVSVNN